MRIIYFDICSLLVLSVIYISMFFRGMNSGRTNKFFMSFMATVLMCNLIGLFAFFPMLGTSEYTMKLGFIGETIYRFGKVMCTLVYIMFAVNITKTTNTFAHTFKRIMLVIPLVCLAGVLMYNAQSGTVFYITEGGAFENGLLWFLPDAVNALYLLILFICIGNGSKNLNNVAKTAALFSYPFFILLSFTMEYSYTYLRVSMFAMTASALIISIILLRPEDLIDPAVGAKTYGAFEDDIKGYYASKYDANVVLVKIKNNRALMALLGDIAYRSTLKSIGGLIKKSDREAIRKDCELYYLNDGIFVMLFENKNPKLVESEARRIVNTFKEEFIENDVEIKINVSVCAVRLKDDFEERETFMNFCGSFEKSVPESEAVIFSKLDPATQRKFQMNIDEIIKKAITRGNFKMYYQPIYSLKERKFVCCESMIRLIDDEYGFVSPADFVPAAERSGAIVQIGDFIIRDVFRFISESKVREYGLKYADVNLSVTQFMTPGLTDKIMEYLDEYKLSTDNIVFEITETATDFINEVMINTALEIKSLGFNISLDDYGTGYSNMMRVMSMPFKTIKFDKSFADQVGDDRMRIAIRDNVQMIKDIGAEIIVEGVEDKETAAFFAGLECEYIQGFYYAKPMPEKEFEEFLRVRNEAG